MLKNHGSFAAMEIQLKKTHLKKKQLKRGWRLVYEDVPCQRRPLDEATWQFLKLRLPLHASICVYMFMYSCTVLIHKVHD